VALIELSPETPAPPAAAAPPPAWFYRRAGLTLAALLLLVLGGAAPASSVLFRRIGTVPIATGADFQLVDGILYTMDLEAEPRVLTAWSPRTLRRLWDHAGTTIQDPFFVSASTAGYTVLRAGRGISVLDARTGALRWSSPVAVQPVNDRIAFVEEEIFRPGTEYDAESGDPGQLYGTNTGALHTEPALRTELRGVHLADGGPVWSRTLPGTVFTAWAGAPENTVVVLTSDKLMVLSPTTGAVLREQPVPLIGGRPAEAGEVVGDTILVRYGDFGTGGLVAAYALDTLDRLWQQDQPDPAGNSADCLGLICVTSRDALTVLDPRTGRESWRTTDSDLLAFGPDSVLEVRGMSRPLRTADLATGRPRTDLGRWRSYSPVEGEDAFVLTRLDEKRNTVFGLLRHGAAAVQPLGRVPDTTVQCQSVPGLLACRVAAGLEVWAIAG
jgi:outer membrane protein assembly factor BamB